MATFETETQRQFSELCPGDKIELVHEVKVGSNRWKTNTVGIVVRTERRRHGLHYRRNIDDKVFSDLIVLKLDRGEITTVTIDEFSEINILAQTES